MRRTRDLVGRAKMKRRGAVQKKENGSHRGGRVRGSVARGLVVGASAVLLGALFGASGCDTVARIGFQERSFQSIRVAGFVPSIEGGDLGASCRGSQGKARLQFVLRDDQSDAIKAGEQVGLSTVNLTAGALSTSNTAVFSLPDRSCGGDDGVDCGDGLSCGLAPGIMDEDLERCHSETPVTVLSAPRFVADTGKNQFFGVLLENTGSLTGRLPEELTSVYPDVDRDGVSDFQPADAFERERGSDPRNARNVGMQSLGQNWENVAQAARAVSSNTRQTFFGAWTFGGSTATIASLVAGSAQFTPEPDLVSRAMTDYGALAPENNARAAVFESIEFVLDNFYATDAAGDFDKWLLVFVDGYDELRLNSATADSVIEKAQAQRVKLLVLHLDRAIQTETEQLGKPLLVDDWAYYENQETCSSDSDCKDFESCREPIWYLDRQTATTVAHPDNSAENPTYCMPDRDETGRVGPIGEYARMACETGGSYLYAPSPTAAREQMRWLPFVMDGLWEVDVQVDDISRDTVSSGAPYKVSANFSVTLDETEVTVPLSQTGRSVPSRDDGDSDTRVVLFSAPD